MREDDEKPKGNNPRNEWVREWKKRWWFSSMEGRSVPTQRRWWWWGGIYKKYLSFVLPTILRPKMKWRWYGTCLGLKFFDLLAVGSHCTQAVMTSITRENFLVMIGMQMMAEDLVMITELLNNLMKGSVQFLAASDVGVHFRLMMIAFGKGSN